MAASTTTSAVSVGDASGAIVYHMAQVVHLEEQLPGLLAQLGVDSTSTSTSSDSNSSDGSSTSENQEEDMYYPPTYAMDGFVHATRESSSLLSVGTHFYRSSVGDWVCMELHPARLRAEIKYEPGKGESMYMHICINDGVIGVCSCNMLFMLFSLSLNLNLTYIPTSQYC